MIAMFGAATAGVADPLDAQVDELIDVLRECAGHDFSGSARAALQRRAAQAMHRLGIMNIDALRERLGRDRDLARHFVALLTVQVSTMFRDPPYFRAVREQVVPLLRAHEVPRIWVAGCAGGEELWSLAIVLAEEGLGERVRWYATDINGEALRQARRGIYPLSRFAEFSSNYVAAGGRRHLADYCTFAYGHASFSRQLAGQAAFGEHSLATDEAFAAMHFVSCRNVLIYFGRPLQQRALALMTGSLVAGGVLGLGSRESLRFTAAADCFDALDPAQRLYRRRSDARVC
jgi:chemotaxis protein methyltransferase CheR